MTCAEAVAEFAVTADAACQRLRVACLRLRQTVERLAEVRALRDGHGRTRANHRQMRSALASEPLLLPRHKRRGRWITVGGEIIEFQAHSVQMQPTLHMRRNYGAAEVDYLRQVIGAHRKITFVDAERWLLARRNGRIIVGKKMDAADDPCCSQWRDREPLYLTARQLIERQFSGRSLQRELKRLKMEEP